MSFKLKGLKITCFLLGGYSIVFFFEKKRVGSLSEITIKQFHANKYLDEIDTTHKLNSTKKNLDHDKNKWLKTNSLRIKDSLLIKSKF